MGLPGREVLGGLPVTGLGSVSGSGSRFGAALVLMLASSCGVRADPELTDGPRQPRFVLQGACAPSSVGTLISVDSRDSTCVRSISQPTLVATAAQFDELFDSACAKPEIDFSVNRVLVVPARGATEWFVFPHFVTARSDALEVGLVIRPQGALPPDQLLLLPLTPDAVELRWCRSACVENCDVAIP